MFGLLEQPAGLFYDPTDAVAGGTVTVGQRPEPVNILSQTNLSLLSCLFSFQTFSLSAKTSPVSSLLSRLAFQSNCPVAPGAITDTKYAVLVYYGFPPRPYRVLGSLDATTASGMNAVGYAASKAKALGADAVIFQTKGTQVVGATGFGNVTATQIGGTTFGSDAATSVPITWDKASLIAIKWL
jgi:hypothetical protein